MNKTFKRVTNVTFYAGVGLGLYALVSIFLTTASGACPVDARRPLMIISVMLLLVSVAGQFYVDYLNKIEKRRLVRVDSTNKEESAEQSSVKDLTEEVSSSDKK